MRIQATDVYRFWVDALRDAVGRARILARVERLAAGNPGQHRALTGGVSELKINCGPDYRVYYAQHGDVLVVLLAGGDKSTQESDIKTALALAKNL